MASSFKWSTIIKTIKEFKAGKPMMFWLLLLTFFFTILGLSFASLLCDNKQQNNKHKLHVLKQNQK